MVQQDSKVVKKRGAPSGYGLLLRAYRSRAKLTQEGLAELTEKAGIGGVSARLIGDIECGVIRSSHRITVQLLSDALGLRPEERRRLEVASHHEVWNRKAKESRTGLTDSYRVSDVPSKTVLNPLGVPILLNWDRTHSNEARDEESKTTSDVSLLNVANSPTSRGQFRLDVAYIKTLQANLGEIQEVRLVGEPTIALQMCERRATLLRTTIDQYARDGNSETITRELYFMLGRVLFEEAQIYWGVARVEEAWFKIQPLALEMRWIAKRLRNREIDALADSVMGDLYYIYEKFPLSARRCKRALQVIQDPETRSKILRILALDLANIGEESEFEKTKAELQDITDEGRLSLGFVCSGYEGIGRGYALLGRYDLAAASFDDGWNTYRAICEVGKEPLRAIQLWRSELVAMEQAKLRDTAAISRKCAQALDLAEKHNYSRYAQQLVLIMQKSLN